MIKLFISDLDGTLLYHQGKDSSSISPENQQAIKSLKEAGIEFMIATGRHPDFIMNIFEQEEWNWDTVGFGGSIIKEKNAITYEIVFSYDEMKYFAAVLEKEKDHLSLCFVNRDNNQLIVYPHSEVLEYYSQDHKIGMVDLGSLLDMPIEEYILNALPEPCRCYIWLKKQEDRDVYKQKLADWFPDCMPSFSSPDSIELMKGHGSKAKAIEWIMKKRGLLKEEIAVIGDSDNDRQMLAMTPHSFRMSHGDPSLPASHITNHVWQAVSEVLKWNAK